jgi:hypothetical protein
VPWERPAGSRPSRRVFDGVGKGKVAGRTPENLVVKVENIPSDAANILGQIKIALGTRAAAQPPGATLGVRRRYMNASRNALWLER